VQAEINVAFDASNELSMTVARNLLDRGFVFSASTGGSLRPDTSSMDLIFKRHTPDRPEEEITTLDARIERDYFQRSGTAGPFRIICYSAKDEGREMLARIIGFFEKRKLPYEFIERKKPPNRVQNGKVDAKTAEVF
jgi:hypothetical protein